MKLTRVWTIGCCSGLLGALVAAISVAVSFSITVRYSSAQRRLAQYCLDEHVNPANAKIERTEVENGLLQSVFDYSIEANKRHSVRFYIDFIGNVDINRLIEEK